MLVVRVELWPYGIEEAKELLAQAEIANAGRDETGHRYRVSFSERHDADLEIPALDALVEVCGYDRRQSVWNLIGQAISALRRNDESCSR